MTIHIQLTLAGTDTGPFDIYSSVDGFVVPFETNVPKDDLIAGITIYDAPDGTEIVRLVSLGECENSVDIAVDNYEPTTTTTTTIVADYYYYGVFPNEDPIVEIPTEVDITILDGVYVSSGASGPIPIPFNSTSYDFLWFATPVSSGVKTAWYVNDFNNGLIGGPASILGNLFGDPIPVTVSGVPFNLYISNARTNVITMTMS